MKHDTALATLVPPEARLLNRAQAAAALQISVRMLAKLHAEGEGPRVTRIGARVLYAPSSLELWIAERSQTAE